MKKAVLIAVVAMAASACRGDETIRAYGAAGQTWALKELNGDAFTASATLTFPKPGRIAGKGPCNSYTASLTAPYPWFETGAIAATRSFCPNLADETVFLSALSRATLSEVAGSTLILSNPDGLNMVFIASD